MTTQWIPDLRPTSDIIDLISQLNDRFRALNLLLQNYVGTAVITVTGATYYVGANDYLLRCDCSQVGTNIHIILMPFAMAPQHELIIERVDTLFPTYNVTIDGDVPIEGNAHVYVQNQFDIIRIKPGATQWEIIG